MLTVKSILDAGAALAEEVWPGGKVYINVVPVNFVRPSCLVEVTGLTSEPESRRTAARTANLRITRFQRVDDRHSVQVEVLAEELALLMDRASEPVLWVGDRALDVGRCTGSYENDYCELTVPLSWIDDRDSAPVTELLMEHYKLAVTAGGEE